MYELKKESADGRILVWKVTAQVISEKPILGYGYGMTQRAYNLAQAKYFNKNRTTETEKQNAGYINNLLNDYLEQFVQGGLIGGLLYIFFIIYIFNISYKQRNENLYLYVGILAFILMSCFNIVFYSPQTIIILIFYAAIVYKHQENNKEIRLKNHSIFHLPIIFFSIMLIATFVQANSQINLKSVQQLILRKNHDEAHYIIENKIMNISTSQIYFKLYGDVFAVEGNFDKAIEMYMKAFKYAPSSEIAISIAFCEYQKCNLKTSMKFLNYAINHQPNLFEPYYRLMSIYNKAGNIEKAKEIAHIIVNKEVKVDSEKVRHFKTSAKKYLIEH